jgi:hypothetical protein
MPKLRTRRCIALTATPRTVERPILNGRPTGPVATDVYPIGHWLFTGPGTNYGPVRFTGRRCAAAASSHTGLTAAGE